MEANLSLAVREQMQRWTCGETPDWFDLKDCWRRICSFIFSRLVSDWQEEIETQRQQHEARVMSIRTEEKQKMDKMADDLEQKWRDALR